MGADESADVLVVGGGTAGAVLAARLSEDRSHQVVLLEAGKAYGPDGFPAVLTDQARIGGDADHDWGYTARGDRLSPKIVALRGRTLGGSSAVNGAVAVRARPIDFGRWNMLDWSFDKALPVFKKLENAPDGTDEFRGRSGPFPIRWRRPEDISPSGQAFIDASVHEGFSPIADFNAEVRGGVGAPPLNVVDHVRQNTYRAREVILFAGTYGSAAISLRHPRAQPGRPNEHPGRHRDEVDPALRISKGVGRPFRYRRCHVPVWQRRAHTRSASPDGSSTSHLARTGHAEERADPLDRPGSRQCNSLTN